MRVREIGIAPRPYQDEIPLYGGFSASLRTAKFWARHKGRPIVLASDTDFLKLLWGEWRKEAEAWGHDVPPGPRSVLGRHHDLRRDGMPRAQALFEDMRWFWDTWATPFGQGMPELLVGSPDTLNRRIERVANAVPIDRGVPADSRRHPHAGTNPRFRWSCFARRVMPNWG